MSVSKIFKRNLKPGQLTRKEKRQTIEMNPGLTSVYSAKYMYHHVKNLPESVLERKRQFKKQTEIENKKSKEEYDNKKNKDTNDKLDFIKKVTDNDYLIMKITNFYENYNSRTRYTQDILLRLVYNHNIKIDYICDVNKDEDEKEELKEDDISEKYDDFISEPLITHYDYFNKDPKWRAKQKYKIFYEDYFIKGITDVDFYDEDVYNSINNYEFYFHYLNKDIKNSYVLLKGIEEDLKVQTSHLYTNGNNKIDLQEHKIGKSKIIRDILFNLKLDINFLPKIFTNKEYDSILLNFNLNNFNKELQNYYDTYEVESKIKIVFDGNKKQYIKSMKKAIHDLLNKVGIYVKYMSEKHTERDYDKMIFYYNYFNNEKEMYNGRLTGEHYKTSQAVKTRNTFKSTDGIKLYKNGDYYTTYEVKINRKIKYLMEQKTDISKYKDLIEHILKHDLKIYIQNKNRPYVISNDKFYELSSKRQYDKVNNFDECFITEGSGAITEGS